MVEDGGVGITKLFHNSRLANFPHSNGAMIRILSAIVILAFAIPLHAQQFQVFGKAKVTVMDVDNTTENVVVKQSDGTLGIRAASSISGLSFN